MEYSTDLVKGSIVPIVLSLVRERAMYGYEMVKQVNARSGGKLEWKEGTLYPTLHKLETEGLLKSKWRETSSDEGGRSRKYYAITPAGRRELQRRSAEWKDFSTAINSVLRGA